MMYAIIKIGGKQLKIQEGDTIKLERQENLETEVIYFSDGKEVFIGTPVLNDVHVILEKIEDRLDTKIQVNRFKSKSRYRKSKGFRQPISILKVKSISKGAKKAEAPKADAVVTTVSEKPVKTAVKAVKETKVAVKTAAKTSVKKVVEEKKAPVKKTVKKVEKEVKK